MLVYITTLVLVLGSVGLSKFSGSVLLSRMFRFLGLAILVLVGGLRDRAVGTDSGNYVRAFERSGGFFDSANLAVGTGEYGYWILNWLVYCISDQYVFMFLSIAIIVVGCYHYSICRYSLNIPLSYYIFITLGFYTFFYNGARQGIACAICTLSIGSLLRGEFKKYLLIVLFAALFHKTALIMLPLYFLLRKKNSLQTNFLFGVLGFFTAFSLSYIVDTISQFDSRFQGYATAGQGGGIYMSAVNVLFWLSFYLFKNLVPSNRRDYYDIFLNMLLFSAVISLISIVLHINPSGVLRLTMYFNIGVIFLFPVCYESFANKGSKLAFISVTGVFLFAYFVMTTSRFSQLVPYKLNTSFSLL